MALQRDSAWSRAAPSGSCLAVSRHCCLMASVAPSLSPSHAFTAASRAFESLIFCASSLHLSTASERLSGVSSEPLSPQPAAVAVKVRAARRRRKTWSRRMGASLPDRLLLGGLDARSAADAVAPADLARAPDAL